MPGALEGITIVEFAGIGPGPFTGMMLADHGARVIRIDRPGTGERGTLKFDASLRNREHVEFDLKSDEGRAQVLELLREADGLIEGFRPGVIERLGLGPEVLLEANPRLVIGRMTGWGQDGPMASAAGHDINYIALSGALHTYGREGQKPKRTCHTSGPLAGAQKLQREVDAEKRHEPGDADDGARPSGRAREEHRRPVQQLAHEPQEGDGEGQDRRNQDPLFDGDGRGFSHGYPFGKRAFAFETV